MQSARWNSNTGQQQPQSRNSNDMLGRRWDGSRPSPVTYLFRTMEAPQSYLPSGSQFRQWQQSPQPPPSIAITDQPPTQSSYSNNGSTPAQQWPQPQSGAITAQPPTQSSRLNDGSQSMLGQQLQQPQSSDITVQSTQAQQFPTLTRELPKRSFWHAKKLTRVTNTFNKSPRVEEIGWIPQQGNSSLQTRRGYWTNRSTGEPE